MLFIFFLDETEMTQKNLVFLFLWKTSNNIRGRPNFRNDNNQVTNLESLGLTWKKLANLLGVSTSFWYFCNCPFCGRWYWKTSTCISCCGSSRFTSTNPMKLSAFTCPLSISSTEYFLTLVEQIVAGFHSSALLSCSQNL